MINVEEVDCGWFDSGVNMGHREVRVHITNALGIKKSRFHRTGLPDENINNPIDPSSVIDRIYKYYAYPDLTAIYIVAASSSTKDPLDQGFFPWVEEFIRVIRSNDDEDIRIIVETTGENSKDFVDRYAEFFMDREVGVVIKTSVPSNPSDHTDRLFESAAVCLSTIIGNVGVGAWLAEHAFQINLVLGSDIKRIEEYLDAIHTQFSGSGLANDLVRFIVRGDETVPYETISAVCGMVAKRFGASNVIFLQSNTG